jgi:hypothetical protein
MRPEPKPAIRQPDQLPSGVPGQAFDAAAAEVVAVYPVGGLARVHVPAALAGDVGEQRRDRGVELGGLLAALAPFASHAYQRPFGRAVMTAAAPSYRRARRSALSWIAAASWARQPRPQAIAKVRHRRGELAGRLTDSE